MPPTGRPALIQRVQLSQVCWLDAALVIPAAAGDALLQCLQRRFEVDDQIRRRQEGADGEVKAVIGFVIARAHHALLAQIGGEDFGIFIHSAVLDGRLPGVKQLTVVLKPPSEEINL